MSKTFFVWCTHHNQIFEYKENLADNIFSLQQLMNQPYHDVVFMPVKRFQDLIKWKTKLEEEKQKLIKEQEAKLKMNQSKRK